MSDKNQLTITPPSVTVACYLMNFVVCFGMICALGSKAGSMFGLSIVFTGLFIPLSFLTWYRMLYNAVRYYYRDLYHVIRHVICHVIYI